MLLALPEFEAYAATSIYRWSAVALRVHDGFQTPRSITEHQWLSDFHGLPHKTYYSSKSAQLMFRIGIFKPTTPRVLAELDMSGSVSDLSLLQTDACLWRISAVKLSIGSNSPSSVVIRLENRPAFPRNKLSDYYAQARGYQGATVGSSSGVPNTVLVSPCSAIQAVRSCRMRKSRSSYSRSLARLCCSCGSFFTS